ncbi:MAG: glycosyltransferase family 4 protein [Planctomycetota bacterium]
MNEEQRHSTTEVAGGKNLRPVLIISEHTVFEYSTSLEHLLVGFADESIPVTLVCPPSCDIDNMLSGAVEVVRYPVFDLPFMGFLNRKDLTEQLTRLKPTVLHCLCESKAGLTKKLAHQMDLPYVLSVNSFQQRWMHFAYQRQIHPLSISSNHCAKIIVPAESIAENVTKVYPSYAERIEQINIGTFVEETQRCFNEPSRLPCMVIAHPFRNSEEFENLFGAVRHLIIDGYELMTVVIGNGLTERHMRRLLAALGLLQTVTIVPRLKPWRSVVGASDIFIQPVASSAFNPLLLEAMSVGTVVASCKGEVDDLIIEDKTAAVFDPFDEHSIIQSLQRLLDRRELARQIAQGAQEYLRECHSVSNMVSSILRTYQEAQHWYKG